MTKHIVKLTKRSNYSYSITVSKEIVEKYEWRSKQKLTIEDEGRGSLRIKDWRNNK